jgi:nucleotide-binding universal stress UspA family protein
MPVKKVIKNGTAFVEIIDYVRNESIDLIVMGTHGEPVSNISLSGVLQRG